MYDGQLSRFRVCRVSDSWRGAEPAFRVVVLAVLDFLLYVCSIGHGKWVWLWLRDLVCRVVHAVCKALYDCGLQLAISREHR